MNPDSPQAQSLSPGSRIGPYEVADKIGVGGMGEVYRATDTKLRRDVAIKVLPPGFADDPERLARFQREAQLLAQLHHPNIASIFGLEESDGVRALVLELVEGPTLAERLEAGPLSLETAVAIAVQIAHALEQAHEKGIIHRDLKPQNIKAPLDGDVKVLDFGLAKAIEVGAASGSSADLSMSPTMLESPTLTALHGTQIGVILGTAAYMSPEQAKGITVDKRADIWAFGVVLYEMLVGRSLFASDSVADTLAGVLKTEIDLSMLPPGTPPALRRLLRRCLERNPRNRLHDIADARIVLEEIAADPQSQGDHEVIVGDRAPASAVARWLPWGVAAVAAVTAVGFGLRPGGTVEPGARPLTAFGLSVPVDHYLPRAQTPLLDLSADGQTMLVVAEDERGASIFIRDFDRLEFRRVEGTEGAEQPILSPDGRTIAFVAAGQLRKVSAEGGEPVTVALAEAPRGACWTPEGSIVFSPRYASGLWRVPATGGSPVELTRLDESTRERTHRWPHLLPDGNTVIFTVGLEANTSDYDVARIDALRLDTGERRPILENARMARYTSGYLIFQRRQSLLAVRFDPERLEQVGQPFVIQEGVGGDSSSGAGYFAASTTGAVVFAPASAIAGESALVLRDRDGTETEVPLRLGSFIGPRFSPSGDRLALGIGTGGLAPDDDVYVYDLASGRSLRLTFGQYRGYPTWSADGTQILYTVGASDAQGLATRAADGSGSETMIPVDGNLSNLVITDAWLADGRIIATDTQRSFDVFLIDSETGTSTSLLANPKAAEGAVAMSPNGKFMAYSSTESGTGDVFVESFPQGAGKWQISRDGGGCPIWSRDGRELYFVRGPKLMAAEVDVNGVFRSGPPRELFSGPYQLCPAGVGRTGYDAAPGGGFVLIKNALVPGARREMVMLQGWESADPARETIR